MGLKFAFFSVQIVTAWAYDAKNVKGTVSRDCLLLDFLGLFKIFLKIRGDIRKSRCTTGINDTGGKFAIGINDTGGKFCHRFC